MITIGISFAATMRVAAASSSSTSWLLDGLPPVAIVSIPMARFYIVDWWLVPAYRLNGWEPLLVLDVPRSLDHLAEWWTSPLYRLDERSPALVLDAVGDHTMLGA